MPMIKIYLTPTAYVEIDEKVFRRILVSAQGSLTKLKRLEGSQFPKVDADALKAITELQFCKKELI